MNDLSKYTNRTEFRRDEFASEDSAKGTGALCAFASDIGWAPGFAPKSIMLTGDDGVCTYRLSSSSDDELIYESWSLADRVLILND